MDEEPEKQAEAKPWMIRDVPEYTRREVKVYAARYGVSMGKAIEELINAAIHKPPTEIRTVPTPEFEFTVRNAPQIADALLYSPDITPEIAAAILKRLSILVSGASSTTDEERRQAWDESAVARPKPDKD